MDKQGDSLSPNRRDCIGKFVRASARMIAPAAIALNCGGNGVAQTGYMASSANSLAADAYKVAESAFESVDYTHYAHQHVPQELKLQMCTDCSGFVSWVLQSVSPKHYAAVHALDPDKSYPTASAYEQFFTQSGEGATSGWQRLSSFRELRQGDLIAWAKPDNGPGKGNTGHVMFAMETPTEEGIATEEDGKKLRFINVRVLDCSSVSHFPPEELPPNTHQQERDGLGKGYVRIVINSNDTPIGYWEGTHSGESGHDIHRPTFTHDIAFARLLPLHVTPVRVNP
ncbi:MAG TPA: hypothetical protein V6C81_06555 [Planktothrix sp.]|jgi:hypothetical protein